MTNENDALAAMEAEFDNDPVTPTVITEDMMARRLVWDTVPHEMALETINTMGLPKVSNDVEDREHREAHAREFQFEPLMGLVAAMSAQVAAVQLETIKQIDPTTDTTHEQIFGLVFTGCKGILSELLDTDTLHYPHYQYVGFQPPVPEGLFEEGIPDDEEPSGE